MKCFWIFVVWVFLFGLGLGRWDPDYGWHLRMGKMILEQGIPLKDPFSYTMSEFPFVDHEWLTNVAMYKLDQIFGVAGNAFAAASIVAIALALTFDKRKDFLAVPMFFGIMGWMGRAGARPQVLDWVFFAGLIFLFEDRERWKKWRWLWPAIVAIWVNLHGGYAVGVVVLAVMMGVDAIQLRKIDIKNWAILGLSVIATLLNPYGLRMWGEVLMQMTDPHVRWTIAEWVPFFVTFEMGFWLLVTMVGFLLVKYWRRIEWWRIAVFLGMSLASMSSVRHIGLAFVIVVPLASDLLKIMYDDLIISEEQQKRWRGFYGILLGVSGVLRSWVGFWTIKTSIASEGEYGELFDKYDVETVLWPKVSEGRSVLSQISEAIARWFGEKKEPKKSFLDILKDDGWNVIYEDQVAIVLSRR